MNVHHTVMACEFRDCAIQQADIGGVIEIAKEMDFHHYLLELAERGQIRLRKHSPFRTFDIAFEDKIFLPLMRIALDQAS